MEEGGQGECKRREVEEAGLDSKGEGGSNEATRWKREMGRSESVARYRAGVGEGGGFALCVCICLPCWLLTHVETRQAGCYVLANTLPVTEITFWQKCKLKLAAMTVWLLPALTSADSHFI